MSAKPRIPPRPARFMKPWFFIGVFFLFAIAGNDAGAQDAQTPPYEVLHKDQLITMADQHKIFSAAQHGDPVAQYTVGMWYREGKYVPVDEDEAVRYLRMSAAQGYLAAVTALGPAQADIEAKPTGPIQQEDSDHGPRNLAIVLLMMITFSWFYGLFDLKKLIHLLGPDRPASDLSGQAQTESEEQHSEEQHDDAHKP